MSMLLFVLLSSVGSPARAGDLPSCETPREAAMTLLALLQPDNHHPEQAGHCLDVPEDMEGQRADLAEDLKDVLDARGWYIQVDSLSNDPDYAGEDGDTRVPLVPGEPSIYLDKVDGRWVWSEETVRATPRLHRATFRGLGDRLKKWAPVLATEVLGVGLWQLTLLIGLLLSGWAAGRVAGAALRSRLVSWLAKSGGRVDEAVFRRTRLPMTWLVTASVVAWGIPELHLGVNPARALLFVCRVTMSVSAVLIVLRWIDVFIEVFQQRTAKTDSRMDDQVAPLLGQALRVVTVLLGVIFVLQNVGVDVASLVAGLGIGGLALALAAQDTLANVFGSLMIFLDRPFQVGDWVIIDGSVEGTVEQVGFRSSRIRAFNGSVITLPNAKVADARIDNMGEREYRRFKTTLGLTYDTPPDLVQAYVEGVRATLKAHPDVRQDYYEVHLSGLGASSVEIMVYCFFAVPDWHSELTARSQLILEFMRLAQELGVSFAFPSQSLYLESTPERPLAAREAADARQLAAVVHSFGPGGERSRPGGPSITDGYHATSDSKRGDSSG
ncbi:MAG: mechanosensitive ion channel family protein [Alphaproteobacteria bacterium]|nr:mechanosensitive ion channel family protein [Alphaproteobacteria bacterium]